MGLDAKDAIIFQQLEVIREMTQNNLRRVGQDLWGRPSQDSAGPSGAVGDGVSAGDRHAVDTPEAGRAEDAAQPAEAEQPPERIEDLKAELAGYIGLERVKKEVGDLIDLAAVHKLRRENGLPEMDLSLHMVFSGNPGTGKTMIARLMARVYRSLGLLSKGQLVEVDRSGLVAGYVGQTAIKTQEAVDKALGGVLFIDEAYALTQRRGENDFGQEAVDTLLKAMEDHREDLVVIAAGYETLMKGFVSSNPGLASRFNRFIHFPDYTPQEMLAIFEMQCAKGCYTLEEGARQAAAAYLERKGGDAAAFGNARGVRNLMERILVSQANRLAALDKVDKQALMTITQADVEAALRQEEG